uniref:Partial AB-hydrolase lipase domain-containing protein n=1 Tax=Timema poppense TaxID=170557 RepID=A0A7R9CGT3_TIMPO|nr:unnamed protein product [Timema poppensis]
MIRCNLIFISCVFIHRLIEVDSKDGYIKTVDQNDRENGSYADIYACKWGKKFEPFCEKQHSFENGTVGSAPQNVSIYRHQSDTISNINYTDKIKKQKENNNQKNSLVNKRSIDPNENNYNNPINNTASVISLFTKNFAPKSSEDLLVEDNRSKDIPEAKNKIINTISQLKLDNLMHSNERDAKLRIIEETKETKDMGGKTKTKYSIHQQQIKTNRTQGIEYLSNKTLTNIYSIVNQINAIYRYITPRRLLDHEFDSRHSFDRSTAEINNEMPHSNRASLSPSLYNLYDLEMTSETIRTLGSKRKRSITYDIAQTSINSETTSSDNKNHSPENILKLDGNEHMLSIIVEYPSLGQNTNKIIRLNNTFIKRANKSKEMQHFASDSQMINANKPKILEDLKSKVSFDSGMETNTFRPYLRQDGMESELFNYELPVVKAFNENKRYCVSSNPKIPKWCVENQGTDSNAELTTPEIIEKYGYTAQTHTIVTEDSYILTLHRIPGRQINQADGVKRKVVLVLHGLLASSATFVELGPEKGLGFILSDEGFDVWLGNFRGNTYSREHVRPDIPHHVYWNFSMHEMGQYDIPAMIDYILKISGQKHLQIVAHSTGATSCYIMACLHTKYSAKISLLTSIAPLGPSGFLDPILKKELKLLADRIMAMLSKNDVHYFAPSYDWLANYTVWFCQKDLLDDNLCKIRRLLGFNSKKLSEV